MLSLAAILRRREVILMSDKDVEQQLHPEKDEEFSITVDDLFEQCKGFVSCKKL